MKYTMKKNKEEIIQKIRRLESKKERIRQKNKKKRRKNNNLIFRDKVEAPRRFTRINVSESRSKKEILEIRDNLISSLMPINLSYLISHPESPFNLIQITKNKFSTNGKIIIPEIFSIMDNSVETYLTIKKIISALLIERNTKVILDYAKCNKVDLSTQVILDIILQDFFLFTKKCKQNNKNIVGIFPLTIGGKNIINKEIQKLLFSVGSPSVLTNDHRQYDDIISYSLCVHEVDNLKDPLRKSERKDLDTTALVDYVQDSLFRMKKVLTPEKLDDLCIVIGEILINAEEHSTTKFRFSIGYFEEKKEGDKHFGVFRLVILNFGQTIYEKFKDPDCPNKEIVTKMKNLSESYTKRNLLLRKTFEEESLWTLYALQQGVTSIPPTEYRKRGNGSIQFIESFFNIKESVEADDFSRMLIISGNTKIIFDGSYCIQEKEIENQNFKVMTFNTSGNIEDKPDNKFIKYMDNYFPGTLISAKILLNDDDFSTKPINELNYETK